MAASKPSHLQMAHLTTINKLRIKQQVNIMIQITIEIIIIRKCINHHHLLHNHHPPSPPPTGDSNTINSHNSKPIILIIKQTKPTEAAQVLKPKTRMIITILTKEITTIRILMVKIVNIPKNHHLLHILLSLTSTTGETIPTSAIVLSLSLPHLTILLLQAELF